MMKWRSLSVALAVVAAGCSSTSSSPTTGPVAEAGAGAGQSGAAPPGATGEGQGDGGDDDQPEAGPPRADGGADASDGAPSPGGDSGAGAPAYAPPIITTSISGLVDNTWTYVPTAGALCRDGSPTGIEINVNSASPNLMIYLEGGGQCFDGFSCSKNPSSFSDAAFQKTNATRANGTVFDRALAGNPLAEWNFVYVPYCTGDLHGGNALGAQVPGVTQPQDFVGYVDYRLALARLVTTFPHLSSVLLTGTSAGGAGVPLTYFATASAFGAVPVNALDDSGPPMSTTYVPDCLQDIWSSTYRFDRTALADCGSACATPGNQAITLMKAILQANPSRVFGLVDSTDDDVVRATYGYGASNCSAYPDNGTASPAPMTPAVFAQGQLDTRTELASYPNFGSFLFAGTDHTTIEETTYATREADGVLLTTWMASLLGGTVSNVGP